MENKQKDMEVIELCNNKLDVIAIIRSRRAPMFGALLCRMIKESMPQNL